MGSQDGRQLQDILQATERSTANDAPRPATPTTDEPVTEEEGEDNGNEAPLEYILIEDELVEADEDGAEGNGELPRDIHLAYYPSLDADVPYTEIEVEIDDPGIANAIETDAERSEQLYPKYILTPLSDHNADTGNRSREAATDYTFVSKFGDRKIVPPYGGR